MRQPIRIEAESPRPDWVSRVEESGLVWHGAGTEPYWNEAESVVFTMQAAEVLEDAANELHAMCRDACDEIVRRDWWHRLAIPEEAIAMVHSSWACGDFSLYGRFDLAWDGTGTPKLLEYNADTPTSLLEAAVIQWDWLLDRHPECDQLNSLHEALIARWQEVPDPTVHFACVWDMLEDRQTIAYLAETAEQAGKSVVLMDMGEIGFSPDGVFTDAEDRPISRMFKLYPWEWLAGEPFFGVIGQERGRFTEPAWKMMLSNKGLLAVLWDLHPGHPLLLPAAGSLADLQATGVDAWVEKPFFGREGAGVVQRERGLETARGHGPAEPGPVVFQKRTPLFQTGGRHFVWGLWMVGDTCRGLSVRGDTSPITGNLSRFFPHRIDD